MKLSANTVKALGSLSKGAPVPSVESHRLNNLIRIGMVELHKDCCVAFITDKGKALLSN